VTRLIRLDDLNDSGLTAGEKLAGLTEGLRQAGEMLRDIAPSADQAGLFDEDGMILVPVEDKPRTDPLAYACWDCGVGQGEVCRTLGGSPKRRGSVHAGRRRLAEETSGQ
jgi:hypothetical protein